jgi:hypothetical protein
VREPDEVYYDAASTAALHPAGGATALIFHDVGRGSAPTARGPAPALVDVVVKVRRKPGDASPMGYVQTMYMTSRILPRLQLHWRRARDRT